MTAWTLLDSGCKSATYLMQKDRELLANLNSESAPLLHLYRWSGNCATYGHFIKPFDFLSPTGTELAKLELAQRPTGGGIMFHLFDIAFSLLVPPQHEIYSLNPLESYLIINQKILSALSGLIENCEDTYLQPESCNQTPSQKAFCMGTPTKYDLIFKGKKIGGAAQRRTKNGLLHQGSVFLSPPSKNFLKVVLLPDSDVQSAIDQYCGAILSDEEKYEVIRGKVQRMLIDLFITDSSF